MALTREVKGALAAAGVTLAAGLVTINHALVGVFYAGHAALDLAWNSFLALVIGSGRGRISPGAYRVVLGVCGVFVMLMSVYFLVSGIRFLRSP